MIQAALDITDLEVAYRGRGREVLVVRGVSVRVGVGEVYGLVGESGCGKSTVALAVMGGLPRGGVVRGGGIWVAGRSLGSLDARGLRGLRSRVVSMVYQDAGRALNPAMTIFGQMAEVFWLLGVSRGEVRGRCLAMLDRVRIRDAARVLASYPHELSGGMLQRVVIAMALAKRPALLVLDEPTTALDATVEAEILDLIAGLRRESATAVLFISHNIRVIERMCDRVGVLYAGRLVEDGPTGSVLGRPLHRYTSRLLACLPAPGQRVVAARLPTIPGFPPGPDVVIAGCVFAERCDIATAVCHTTPPPAYVEAAGTERTHKGFCHHWAQAGAPSAIEPVSRRARERSASMVLRARHLSKTFTTGGRTLQALSDVSFSLAEGETLGVVGESGSGKTTLARLLLGLLEADPDSVVELDGVAVGPLAQRNRDQLNALQIVFQNPDSALNRAHSVRRLIGRPLARLTTLTKAGRAARLAALTAAVRLTSDQLDMRPRALSGGLKQRVAIARAFAGSPKIVICDEPTSALDVSVQAAILNLLADLQRDQNVSYILISHDLGVIRTLADRIAVLYRGRIMEIGPAYAVFEGPNHPYTETLLAAAGRTTGPTIPRQTEILDAKGPPAGCVFHTRCPRTLGTVCETTPPPADTEHHHTINCHIPRGDRLAS